MGFRPEVFFQAFKSAGVLVEAIYKPQFVTPVPFDAQWVRPEMLLLGDGAQSVEYRIEYQTADVPRLKLGDEIEVAGTLYTVRAAPLTQGDGYFSQCELDKP